MWSPGPGNGGAMEVSISRRSICERSVGNSPGAVSPLRVKYALYAPAAEDEKENSAFLPARNRKRARRPRRKDRDRVRREKRNGRASVRRGERNRIAADYRNGIGAGDKDSFTVDEFDVCVCHDAKLMHLLRTRLLLSFFECVQSGDKFRIAAKSSEFRAVLEFVGVVAVCDCLRDERNRRFPLP